MRAARTVERRQSQRRLINRVAKIQIASGTLPRDCLLTDISAGGVRLHIEGFEVPEEFVLHVSGEGRASESVYRVVWRLGHEVGARLVSTMQRPVARA